MHTQDFTGSAERILNLRQTVIESDIKKNFCVSHGWNKQNVCLPVRQRPPKARKAPDSLEGRGGFLNLITDSTPYWLAAGPMWNISLNKVVFKEEVDLAVTDGFSMHCSLLR